MSYPFVYKLFPTALSAFILTIAASCGHSHSEAHNAKEAEDGHDHEDEIVMSPADAKRFGVLAEAAVKTPFCEIVKVSGEVLPAATDRSVVSAPTAGIIKLESGIEPGRAVRSGELIALISAGNMTGGDVNKMAKVSLDAAKRELDRLTPLLKDGLITKKEYNEALRSYEEAKSAYSPAAATGRASSSISGIVAELIVSDGSFVEAGQPIATVARSQRLTLKALLPSRHIDMLPRITSANFIPSHSSGEAIRLADRGGKVLSSSMSTADNTPGYLPVYFSFENHGDVVPGTPADVYLVGTQRSDALTVPVGAISEQQGEKFVYVKVEDHAYAKHPVKVGRNDGSRVEILDGISEGDSVVATGTTFIRLAETSTVVPEGHSHNH